MERIWLKHYPEGVPADIDTSAYPALTTLFDECFTKFADRKAFISMNKAITYRELDEMSAAIAAYLQNLGLKKGARVAVMMPNVLQNPVSSTAILRAGFIVVNVNPLYTPRELEHQLKDSGAEVILLLENFAATLQKVLPQTDVKHVVIGSMGDLLGFKGHIVNFVVRTVKKMVPAFSIPNAVAFNDALAAGRGLTWKKPAIGPDDVAFLQYTGGTTGVSKGATLLHRNIVANVLQTYEWLKPGLNKPPITDDQLFVVCALPLYHIFALTACFLLGMRAGGVNLLIANPRDIPGFIKELKKYKINKFPAVNTLYNALLHNPELRNVDFSALKVSVGGGMAVQKAVADKWLEITGNPICEGYGLSETSPVLSCNVGTVSGFTNSIGLPIPSTYMSIRDDDGNDMPLGEPGEICAKGPQVMAGYWNRPDETASVMTADGYFRTGDIGIMLPNGAIRIVDRKKDMILVSGFNVYPNEVEAVIASHPGVLEVAVIGIPDEHSTEAVKAFVVKKDPNLTAQDVIAFRASGANELQSSEGCRVHQRTAENQCRQNFAARTARHKTKGCCCELIALTGHAMTETISLQDVLAFWREAGPDKWFTKDGVFDGDIRSRFEKLYEAARDGQLQSWTGSDDGTLALIIALDQFPRNMFRNDPRAFATDDAARSIARDAIARGCHTRIDYDLRQFIYMPFMHSETMADQELSLSLFEKHGDANNLKFAQIHADIIRKFGRFPHRNVVMQRTTTPAEQAFLDSGGFLG